MLMLRNAEDFSEFLRDVAENGKLTKPEEERWREEPDRPAVVLLYTDEDPHVAAYIRTHMDALDKASGEYCDVLIVERPDSSASSPFWRRLLTDSHYIAWKLLGWADALPYNRNEAYHIAGRLGVPFDKFPCAVGIELTTGLPDQVFPLSEDLTSSFRRVFSHYQRTPSSPSNSGIPFGDPLRPRRLRSCVTLVQCVFLATVTKTKPLLGRLRLPCTAPG
jgi:hypothetical protein